MVIIVKILIVEIDKKSHVITNWMVTYTSFEIVD